ncbi:hypothetical protein CIT25_28560 [Mesorhizobium mediterraneum]|uniref:Autotransporter domain-containing protein n=2 Tax=Phyllobacteriaceae TaxID=69277 RepID=A0AB36R2V0_9HYPH|nr:hypothetical protein CIT25_28560 [Mesorhizobium mediterraneum]
MSFGTAFALEMWQHGSKVDCMHKREMSNALLSWRLGSRFDCDVARSFSRIAAEVISNLEGTVGAAAIKHIFLFFAALVFSAMRTSSRRRRPKVEKGSTCKKELSMTSYVRTNSPAQVRSLSTFGKHLQRSVLTAALLAAASTGSEAQPYVRADGSTTGDLEAARASWRHDAEFNGNVGLGAINADAAYALGFTGKGARAPRLPSSVLTSARLQPTSLSR